MKTQDEVGIADSNQGSRLKSVAVVILRSLTTVPIMRLSGTIALALSVQEAIALSSPFGSSCRSKTLPFGRSKQHLRTHLFSTKDTVAPPLPPAIQLDGLTCSHDGGSTYQLKDVSYVLPRGGRIGLVGRNGCGVSFIGLN